MKFQLNVPPSILRKMFEVHPQTGQFNIKEKIVYPYYILRTNMSCKRIEIIYTETNAKGLYYKHQIAYAMTKDDSDSMARIYPSHVYAVNGNYNDMRPENLESNLDRQDFKALTELPHFECVSNYDTYRFTLSNAAPDTLKAFCAITNPANEPVSKMTAKDVLHRYNRYAKTMNRLQLQSFPAHDLEKYNSVVHSNDLTTLNRAFISHYDPETGAFTLNTEFLQTYVEHGFIILYPNVIYTYRFTPTEYETFLYDIARLFALCPNNSAFTYSEPIHRLATYCDDILKTHYTKPPYRHDISMVQLLTANPNAELIDSKPSKTLDRAKNLDRVTQETKFSARNITYTPIQRQIYNPARHWEKPKPNPNDVPNDLPANSALLITLPNRQHRMINPYTLATVFTISPNPYLTDDDPNNPKVWTPDEVLIPNPDHLYAALEQRYPFPFMPPHYRYACQQMNAPTSPPTHVIVDTQTIDPKTQRGERLQLSIARLVYALKTFDYLKAQPDMTPQQIAIACNPRYVKHMDRNSNNFHPENLYPIH